ncbi:MAG TPA: phenylalanine--tRNA ligase subunit beta [Pyrinomonadaceae bacterium]|nr:phenylalanine--tRNA ligase subunit beta [Pyrinomonadaceae bacterium]
MLISYQWLRELSATALTPAELRDRLTMVGLAIDAVENKETDSVLDVEVPSNRPDCLSHVGVAREVTVIERTNLRLPVAKSFKTAGNAAELTVVTIDDPQLCPRYAARLIKGVKIGPSPEWLVRRLEVIGQRSINNVADITNYVLHELGQPLHAFDFDKLSGKRIVVRRARAGERLKTLDGFERDLTDDTLVIADAVRPVALAGIMGGEDSEISEQTTDVLIESAYFDANSIRRTARRLGMDTEASRRFERGADRENVINAQQRCVELICELAGGLPTEDVIDVYPGKLQPRSVTLRIARVKDLTSLSVEPKEMDRILTALGFAKQSEGAEELVYIVPSWRNDVEQEEDLIEEIARHTGFEKIASELPPSSSSGEYQPGEMKQRILRRALNSFGFDEAINFSFIPREGTDLLGITAEAQPLLKNPIIEGSAWMRSSLLPGLLSSLRHNFNHGNRDVRLFEIGRIFNAKTAGELPAESLSLALIATGGALEEARVLAERDLDFFDLKGAVETAVELMNLPALKFVRTAAAHLRQGQSASIGLASGREIGSMGRLSDAIGNAYKFRQPVYVLELQLSALLASEETVVHYSPLPRFPSIVRDISLLIDRNTTFEEVVRDIKGREVQALNEVRLVGTYEGANIPATKRSITLRIEYRADERTLRDEEVEETHAQLTSSLLKTFAAEQR